MAKKDMRKLNFDPSDKIFLIWERHWLAEWGNLEASDKKVLAALYWEELTDQQKSEFEDAEYIELQKIKDAKQAELIADPIRMKKHFLKGASPLIDEMVGLANGNKKKPLAVTETELWAKKELWSVLKEVITSAENPAPMLDLKGKTIDDQIDQILTKVSTGLISIEDAKEYMALVSAGFNLQQLPKLLTALEALEDK